MPAVVVRSGRRGRRAVAEINMVPFIDVMLVLLIIFMVSAPLLAPSLVDLPSVGQARAAPVQAVEVTVAADGALRLRRVGAPSSVSGAGTADTGGGAGASAGILVDAGRLVAEVRRLQGGDAAVPVVIAADKTVRYESVVRTLDALQRAGMERVGLAVRAEGGGAAGR